MPNPYIGDPETIRLIHLCEYPYGQNFLTVFNHILVGVNITTRRKTEIPSVTEIYVCKPGQDLKNGELLTRAASKAARTRNWMRGTVAGMTTESPKSAATP